MTTNERIEAEIAAEVERIEAWNKHQAYVILGGSSYPLLDVEEVESLAEHLVHNRRQENAAKDAQHKRLVEAARAVLPAIRWGMTHQPGNLNQWTDCEAQIEAALKAEVETP